MAPRPRANPPLTAEQRKQLAWMPWNDIQRVFKGFTRAYLWEQRAKAQSEFPVETKVDLDSVARVERTRTREYQRLYDAALVEIDRLKTELNTLAGMPKPHARDLRITAANPKQREAAALILASDWHCEERVERESVNGLNEYNLDVFHERSRWFATNALKLVRKEAKSIRIKQAVAWFGGDLMSGDIHQDVSESCALGPMDAMTLAQDTVLGCIKRWLSDTPDDFAWTVVFSAGNHSRTTDEQLIANEHAHSLEWFMSANIAKALEGEPRVRIVRERAYLTYLDVFGRTLRFHHGHAIRYSGGIGGVTIPLLKAIARFNLQKRAYLDLLGHYHQRIAGEGFLMNGSLIGLSPYALRMGARAEPASQTFALIDSQHGLTVTAPVILEEA